MDVLEADHDSLSQGDVLKPQLDLANPQHKGRWGALSPIPETNAIAVDSTEDQEDTSHFHVAVSCIAQSLKVQIINREKRKIGKILVVFMYLMLLKENIWTALQHGL